MKDSLKFRGEVIARNKATGEILFKQHNCIVEGGRIMTLAKAFNMNNAQLKKLAQPIEDGGNSDLSDWFENCTGDSGDYSIMKFKAGFDRSSEVTGTAEVSVNTQLSVNTQATDLNSSVVYIGDIDFFTKEDAAYTVKDDIPTIYYEGANSYTWDDSNSHSMQPLINKAGEFDTIFIRYKLMMKMPEQNASSGDPAYVVDDPEDTSSQGWHNPDLTVPYVTINELGLFMSSEEEVEDGEWLMFSLLKFPPITLQAEMEVEFEYRIYG